MKALCAILAFITTALAVGGALTRWDDAAERDVVARIREAGL